MEEPGIGTPFDSRYWLQSGDWARVVLATSCLLVDVDRKETSIKVRAPEALHISTTPRVLVFSQYSSMVNIALSTGLVS